MNTNLRNATILIVVICLSGLVPLAASAAVIMAEEAISPADDVSSDMYAAAERVTIGSRVNGDALLFANSITIEQPAQIDGDLIAASGEVSILGPVADDMLIIAGSISLQNSSAEDVFLAGETIEIDESTTISGDVYIAASTVTISGTINGTARVAAESVTLSPTAQISGDLKTWGRTTPIIKEGATIFGDRSHFQVEKRSSELATLLAWARNSLTLFVVATALIYLLPQLLKAAHTEIKKKTLASWLTGSLWFLLFVPAVILLAIVQVTWPLALLIAAFTLTITTLGTIFAAPITGFTLTRFLKLQSTRWLSWHHALIGACAISAILLIPVVGPLAVIILATTTTGALLKSLFTLTSLSKSS